MHPKQTTIPPMTIQLAEEADLSEEDTCTPVRPRIEVNRDTTMTEATTMENNKALNTLTYARMPQLMPLDIYRWDVHITLANINPHQHTL